MSPRHVRPTVIGPGMAVLPPLPRMLFWTGYVTEQALVVNVRGFGLVLISGCGHDSTPRTYDAFTRRFGERYRTLRAGEELRIPAP